jgi:fructose-1,6-bisphosphatase/inositol monophosphatase family enzyme
MSSQRDTDGSALIRSLTECAARVQRAIAEAEDWATPGSRATQYWIDLVADDVAVEFLLREGFDVVSEESGCQRHGGDITVVVDPVDGTANAVRGLPWFSTSLCAMDRHGPVAAVVHDLGTGTTYDAARGMGARVGGLRSRVTNCARLGDAFIGYSGLPRSGRAQWSQGRAIGSLAMTLCHVATGALDGFVDFDRDVHGPWDYLGGLFIATESGAVACEPLNRPLLTVEHSARRSPIVAGTADLLFQLRAVAASEAT